MSHKYRQRDNRQCTGIITRTKIFTLDPKRNIKSLFFRSPQRGSSEWRKILYALLYVIAMETTTMMKKKWSITILYIIFFLSFFLSRFFLFIRCSPVGACINSMRNVWESNSPLCSVKMFPMVLGSLGTLGFRLERIDEGTNDWFCNGLDSDLTDCWLPIT